MTGSSDRPLAIGLIGRNNERVAHATISLYLDLEVAGGPGSIDCPNQRFEVGFRRVAFGHLVSRDIVELEADFVVPRAPGRDERDEVRAPRAEPENIGLTIGIGLAVK